MVNDKDIRRARDKKFSKFWKSFVNKMNSGKKPLILRLFGSKFPRNDLEKSIAKYSFREGFYVGAMYMAEQIPINKTGGIKKNG